MVDGSLSILTSTKKVLGVDESVTAFDLDIVMHINTAFATLTQLGVGPSEGFFIEDSSAVWAPYVNGNPYINMAKTYVAQKVRMYFDPPATSFHIAAIEKQIAELEWRLNVAVEKGPEVEGYWWEIDEANPLPEDAPPGTLAFDPVTGNVWRLT